MTKNLKAPAHPEHTARPRASDTIVTALLMMERDGDNQPIADAIRALGWGVSFSRINRLRAQLRKTRKRARR